MASQVRWRREHWNGWAGEIEQLNGCFVAWSFPTHLSQAGETDSSLSIPLHAVCLTLEEAQTASDRDVQRTSPHACDCQGWQELAPGRVRPPR